MVLKCTYCKKGKRSYLSMSSLDMFCYYVTFKYIRRKRDGFCKVCAFGHFVVAAMPVLCLT